MYDLQLVETGSGGDLVLNGNDLKSVFSFENMPYLAMFGGNVAASKPNALVFGQQNFDYWGNWIIDPNNTAIHFNSLTERVLRNTALTSAGRIIIQNAVIADLQFMAPFAKITVNVTLPGINIVRIQIFLQEPDNLEATEFIFLWNAALQELQGAPTYLPNPGLPAEDGLQYQFPFPI